MWWKDLQMWIRIVALKCMCVHIHLLSSHDFWVVWHARNYYCWNLKSEYWLFNEFWVGFMHSLERQIARLESQCKISLKDHPQRSRYYSCHCTLPLISHKVHYVGPIFCLACVNFWALWDANWLWLRLAFASAKWKLTISFVVYFVHVTWHCVQHTQQAREWWGEISIKTSSPSHPCMHDQASFYSLFFQSQNHETTAQSCVWWDAAFTGVSSESYRWWRSDQSTGSQEVSDYLDALLWSEDFNDMWSW